LRAFTPRDQKAVRSAAETFRANPAFAVETVITELETGEALTSFLDEKGAPGVVERAYIIPPRSRIGTITPAERAKIVNWSPVQGRYETTVDRESAYELLKVKAERAAAAEAAAAAAEEQAKREEAFRKEQAKLEKQQGSTSRRRRSTADDNVFEDFAQSTARSLGTSVGRSLVRGILGSLSGRNR
jgi:hypothetical protein